MRTIIGLVSFCLAGALLRAAPQPVKTFGTLPDGRTVHLYTLKSSAGFEVQILDYGCIVTSLKAPDQHHHYEDVVLGFNDLDDYLKKSPYFGAIVGRVANRIAHGRFELDGKTYSLPLNDKPNGVACSLHGGTRGFDKVLWTAEPTERDRQPALRLKYTSPNGDQGYPGNLQVEVLYSINGDNGLQIDFHATTDAATPVNFANHSYFNLAGEGNGTILGQTIQIAADTFTPVDPGLIPTGEFRPVAGTPFDFRTPHSIGERIDANDEQLKAGGGYDHNFVLSAKTGGLHLAATVHEPQSGRTLEVITTEPGLQFYSGNFLDGTLTGKSGKTYSHRSAMALETQHFPDSIHHPEFPNTVLRPGETFKSTTIYRFSAGPGD